MSLLMSSSRHRSSQFTALSREWLIKQSLIEFAMHGRRRAETKALKRDPKISAKLAKKASLWYQLQTELLKRRRELTTTNKNISNTLSSTTRSTTTADTTSTTTTTLQLIENALSVNPDPLWLWNFRRELISSLPNCFSWENEASLTQAALESNPKAYGAWHHRKWCCQKSIAPGNSPNSSILLESELALTAMFLQHDERNFHCWSYRRFVVSCLLHGHDGAGVWQIDEMEYMGAQIGGGSCTDPTKPTLPKVVLDIHPQALSILEAEWKFTDQKIRANFSNFSAFHYRSKLLPILKKDFKSEFETINNAICTEPDDQTAWWYQSFLLEYASSQGNKDDTATAKKLDDNHNIILTDHIALLRELQDETENKSKWVLLGLFKALSFQTGEQQTLEEQRDILQRLETVDSDRKMRYQYLQRNLETAN